MKVPERRIGTTARGHSRATGDSLRLDARGPYAACARVAQPYISEIAALRSRIEFVDLVERRVLALTRAQRKQFEALMGVGKP